MSNNKIVRSIQGSEVDFDLMKVKQDMLRRDKPDAVEVREQYIDIRRRRNPRRNVADLEREQQANIEDARAKIEQSKKNRLANEAKNIKEDAPVVTVDTSSPAVISAGDIVDSKPKPTSPKKKIVKNENN